MPNLALRMLSERHPCTPSVEDDQYNRFPSGDSPVECIDCLGNGLSGGKALRLTISPSLKGQFSGDNIRSAGHRMTMPFQLSVWRESDSQDRQLWPAQGVTFVWFTIPSRTRAQKDLFLYRWLMIPPGSGFLDQRNRKRYEEECFDAPPRCWRYYIHDPIPEAVIGDTVKQQNAC